MKKPMKLLSSKYRRDMWVNVVPNFEKMTKFLPVEEAYIIGSFSGKKRRPADVDFMVFFKVNEKQKNDKWSFDFIVAPNNEHGEFVLEDIRKWMCQKYGKKNFEIMRVR